MRRETLIETLITLLFSGSCANMMLDDIDQTKGSIKAEVVDSLFLPA
jgi:hypothetical protein